MKKADINGWFARASVHVCADCLEERVKISKGTAARTRCNLWPRKEPASRPTSHVRIPLLRPTENSSPLLLGVHSPSSLLRLFADGEAKRRNTGRPRLILGANTPTGITLGLFCRSTQKIFPRRWRAAAWVSSRSVYLRDHQQRDLDNGGLITEPSRRMLCSARA